MEEETKKSEKLPPGFRFHPTDEELITYYLNNKISDSSFTGIAITDVDLNRCEPWDLPEKATMGEKEWYFFSLRDRKYPTGLRTNRATNAGYWKTTGKDKEIFHSSSSELVGMKKTLVFYKGRAPRGEKTDWVIHEYRNQFKTTFKNSKDEWVVCRVFQKSSGGKKYPTSNQSKSSAANIYNHDYHQMMSSSTVTPHQGHDPYHLGVGRNYMGTTDLADLTRIIRGNGSSDNNNNPNTMMTMMLMNLNQSHQQQQGFSVSGLNLNLGVVPRSVVQPQFTAVVAPPPAPIIMTSSGCADVGFMHCGIHDTAACNDKFIGTMEPCLELEGYWSNY